MMAPPPNFAWRPTDVQCGLFASGKALLRYGVPFTYIENCWLDSPLLKEEIEKVCACSHHHERF